MSKAAAENPRFVRPVNSHTKKAPERHGDLRGRKRTPEYRSWESMHARCRNPNYSNYVYYGGRGIRVCRRWGSFVSFLKDMGRRPSCKHSLDRKRTNGNYTPSNCRWATRVQQMRNTRRLSFFTLGATKLSSWAWSKRLGIPHQILKWRQIEGWSDVRILTQPIKKSRLLGEAGVLRANKILATVRRRALCR